MTVNLYKRDYDETSKPTGRVPGKAASNRETCLFTGVESESWLSESKNTRRTR